MSLSPQNRPPANRAPSNAADFGPERGSVEGLQPVPEMTLDEVASYERGNRERIVFRNGIYWRQIRPFFYQPLFAFQEYGTGKVRAPFQSSFGGFQHALSSTTGSNTRLRFVVFDQPSQYGLEDLDGNRKRQVRLATKQFAVRPIADPKFFCEHGYPVYLQFYERSRYGYLSERQTRKGFDRWTQHVFQQRKLLVLGAFADSTLRAVSINYVSAESWFYASFFSDLESRTQFVSDLMLHEVRQRAARQPGVERIVAGRYKGGTGQDRFYLLRGAKLWEKPAILRVNPIANLLLRCLSPRRYRALWGKDEPIAVSAPRDDSKKGG